VQVLLVRGRDSSAGSVGSVRVPRAYDRFEQGETLIVAGTKEGLDHIEGSAFGRTKS